MTAWRLNPKSHTAQEQVRQEKKREAERVKHEKSKAKRRKKRSANEAFADEGDTRAQKLENGMTLISDLAKAPAFLAGFVEGSTSTLSAP